MMAVNTKQVAGRRELHFDSYDQILGDVHRLAARPYRQLGNWSLGDICQHLAKSIDMAIDGSNAQFPWLLRKIAPLLKNRFISRPIPAGYTIPPDSGVEPDPEQTAAGVATLEKSVQRIRELDHRQPHPLFGSLTREQWDQFQFRHCELHLSFLVPE